MKNIIILIVRTQYHLIFAFHKVFNYCTTKKMYATLHIEKILQF